MILLRTIVASSLILGMVCCQADETSDNGQNQFVKWANNNAIPILTTDSTDGTSDLKFLGQLVGDAKLVGLGDSRHDASEQFLLKVKFIKYLVSDLGFNMIGIEEGLPHAEKINRYLLHGTGDIEELMNQMGAWFIWDTEEFFVLIQWLREHNLKSPQDKQVKFAGIDITDPLPGIEIILTYFRQVDSVYTNFLAAEIDRDIYRVDMWRQIVQNYTSTDKNKLDQIGEQFDLILTRLQEDKIQYIEKSVVAEYEWVYRNAECLIVSHDLFRKLSEGDLADAGLIRETAMSGNLLWHLASSGENSRGIVWAHNYHVGKGEFDLNIPNNPLMSGLIPMGKYLADTLGEKFVSIGMSFHDANFLDESISTSETELIDGTLAEIKYDTYILNLRAGQANDLVNSWLTTKQPMRGQNNSAHLILKDSFDMIAFVRQISKTTPSQKAIARHKSIK